MSAITRAMLLTLCLSLYAGAQNRSLGLYAGEAPGLDESAVRAAQRELQRLLAPAGIDMFWKGLERRTAGEQFDRVAVISFDGWCSDAGAALVIPSKKLDDSQISLADSSVSNGSVLPFFRVDCASLVRMLAPSLRTMPPSQRDAALGRALGRVMAHEIYHIVGETTAHQTRGVAKESFSVRDLIGDAFDFDLGSVAQMMPTPPLLARSITAPASSSPLPSEPEEALER
jgi:hypothetical protein